MLIFAKLYTELKFASHDLELYYVVAKLFCILKNNAIHNESLPFCQ